MARPFPLPPDLKPFARQVVERRLDNGMTVLIVPRRASATLHFAIAFSVGGVDEPEGRSGIAHLYEHMAFKGTTVVGTRNWKKERPVLTRLDELDQAMLSEREKGSRVNVAGMKRMRAEFDRLEKKADAFVAANELDELYSRNGAKGLNAYTSKDATVYMVNLPANRLELWAVMEAQRLREPVLRQFYRERNVVMEELRRYDDMPHWRLYETLPAIAFTAHPYRTPVIGWLSDLERMTRPDLERFFRKRYRPERAVAVIVGDTDPDQAVRLIRREFGSWQAEAPAPRPLTTVEPAQRGGRRCEQQMQANPLLGMAWPAPTWGHPDKAAMDALAAILGRSDSSRLNTALVKQKKIAIATHAMTEFPGERYPNLLLILAMPRAPHGNAESEKAVEDEIQLIKDKGVSQRELDKVTNLMEADIFQRLGEGSRLAPALAHTHAVTGDWRTPLRAVQELRALKPEDVRRAACEHLAASRLSVVTVESRKEGT